jgi:hypothetical protein
MLRVYKYPLIVADLQHVALPIWSRPLTVQVQQGALCLWALVNPAGPTRGLAVRMVGTGHDFADALDWTYLATVQLHGGDLVYHVFIEPR